MKKWRLPLALSLTVLWLWFIFARSAMNAEESDAESGAVLELLLRFFPFLTMHLVRKLAHITEYGILGVLLCLDWKWIGKGNVLLPAGVGLLAAAADEYLQTFIPGRSGEIRDVLLDFSGVAAGIAVLLLLFRWKEAKHRAK